MKSQSCERRRRPLGQDLRSSYALVCSRYVAHVFDIYGSSFERHNTHTHVRYHRMTDITTQRMSLLREKAQVICMGNVRASITFGYNRYNKATNSRGLMFAPIYYVRCLRQCKIDFDQMYKRFKRRLKHAVKYVLYLRPLCGIDTIYTRERDEI